LQEISRKKFLFNFHFLPSSTCNLLEVSNLSKVISKFQPDILINCAAYTNVDLAEAENKIAYSLNAESVKDITQICKELDCFLIHFSTDYVFDGEKREPYEEHDRCLPVNVYGQSKLLGEKYIIESDIPSLIIRTSWLFSHKENNFLYKILSMLIRQSEIKIISNQVGTPTNCNDLSCFVLNQLEKIYDEINFPTVMHFSGKDACSWFDFGYTIAENAKKNGLIKEFNLVAVESKDTSQVAERPLYSALSVHRIEEAFGICLPSWKDSLLNTINKVNFN